MESFSEGKVSFTAENRQTRDSDVFFNPDRKFGRNLNVLLLNVLGRKGLHGMDLMAASGVRGLRLCAETGAFSSMVLNDLKTAVVIKRNTEANRSLFRADVSVSSFNAVEIGAEYGLLDYVDIDPFGSPVPYLPTAMDRIRTGGIIALTATDTAALYGRANRACLAKYGAVSCKTSYYNELGLRILLKRTEEIAAAHGKSVEPFFFDVRKHYARAYVMVGGKRESEPFGFLMQCSACPNRTLSGAEKCSNCGSKMLRLGPLWVGKLFDRGIVQKMHSAVGEGREKKYLAVMKDEEDIISYYTTTEMAGYTKQPEKKTGLIGSRTAFLSKGFRTELGFTELVRRYSSL